MTDIEAKALALVNEVLAERVDWQMTGSRADNASIEALCRSIEQHEAFKQEVSDAATKTVTFLEWCGCGPDHDARKRIAPFIIPDPLVEAWIEATGNTVGMEPLNAALEARGLEIREKGQ
jgi:hypothetical protein